MRLVIRPRIRLRGRAVRVFALAGVVVLLLAAARSSDGFSIDRDGDARLGLRTYTAVRVGTNDFQDLSFPPSYSGQMRQNRFFLELELNHDVTRLMETTNGPVSVFRHLPFSVDRLRYNLTYRFEAEGLYDYGPKPYTTFDNYKDFDEPLNDYVPPPLQTPPELIREYGKETERRARRVGRFRSRLFQAYGDLETGPVFVRLGRQNLSWGETDSFRLLDNINPLDNGFGGFFIDLDERRIPLDMLRVNVSLPDRGPFSQSFFEGFGAFGNRVAFEPGIAVGNPWNPAGLNYPAPQQRFVRNIPDLDDFRGGGRVVFNVRDITFSMAHYWTYLDIPAVKLRVRPGLPSITNRVQVIQQAPLVPITGGSMTFAVPEYYAVVRSEFAYFFDEAANCQGIGTYDEAMQDPNNPDPTVQAGLRKVERNLNGCIDPFHLPGFALSSEPIVGRAATKDSVNYVIGFDVNRFIPWINPSQTVFFTTQFFYKYIVDAFDDQVLPVIVRFPNLKLKTSPLAPLLDPPGRHGAPIDRRLVKVRQNQFLHTLRVQTSYRGGTIQPQFTLFYDWTGVWFYQPGIRFVRDPFRLVVDYTGISGVLGGQLGLLRDRDNVRFQVEAAF